MDVWMFEPKNVIFAQEWNSQKAKRLCTLSYSIKSHLSPTEERALPSNLVKKSSRFTIVNGFSLLSRNTTSSSQIFLPEFSHSVQALLSANVDSPGLISLAFITTSRTVNLTYFCIINYQVWRSLPLQGVRVVSGRPFWICIQFRNLQGCQSQRLCRYLFGHRRTEWWTWPDHYALCSGSTAFRQGYPG